MLRARGIVVFTAALLLSAGLGAKPEAFTEVPRTDEQRARDEKCSRMHYELRQKHGDDVRARRDGLRAQRQQCEGTGSWEFMLGLAERGSGDSAAAAEIYEDAVRRKLPFYERSFVALNTLRAQAAFDAKPPDMKRFQELHEELEKFAIAHPQIGFAFMQLGTQSMALKNWDAAASHSRKAMEIEPDSPRPRRQLVIALHEGERCQEAVREIRPAIELDGSLLADDDFMFSAADCYAEAGELANGKAALEAHLKKNAASKDDPRAVQLQRFFESKLGPSTEKP